MLYCSITGGFEKKFSFLWHKDLPGQEPWIDYYTPKMCTSMPQTGYILFWFFSLSVTDGFNFLPSHKNTFIWILEFGQLPGLRLWYSSLLMVKRQRRKRHGKGSIFSWSTGALRDDQSVVRCSAEHACHSSSSTWTYTWSGRAFPHSAHLWSSYQVTSLQMDLSIPTHEEWLCTAVPQQLHAVDHCSPSQVWNGYPAFPLNSEQRQQHNSAAFH